MKRKVVKHGTSTLTISLPSKWARTNKIKNGQLLDIEVSEGKAVILLTEKNLENIEINFTSNEEWYIHRTLRHLYTSGYDEIKINYTKKEQLQLIRKSLVYLSGMEIIESNPSYCILKCVTFSNEENYEKIVEKILWLILSQFDYFLEDIKKEKPVMNEEISEIFLTISKLNNLCRRMINKRPIFDAIISKYEYWFLTSLLNISSFILYSYQYLSKNNKIMLTEKEVSLLKTDRNFFYRLLLAYKNLDTEKTREFFEEREALFDGILDVLKEKNPVISHYLLDILKEMSSIGNLILNLKVSQYKK